MNPGIEIYEQAITEYLSGTINYNYYFKESELDINKKAFLKVRKLNREAKFQKALDILKSLRIKHEVLNKAEHQFLLAQTYGHLGDFEQATIHNHNAVNYYLEMNNQRGLFICHYNLGVDYEKLNLNKLAKEYYQKSHQYVYKVNQKLLSLRAQANLFSKNRMKEDAFMTTHQIIEQCLNMNTFESNISLLVASSIYSNFSEYEKSYEILTMIDHKQIKTYKDRYLFQKEILSAILRERRIIAPPGNLKNGKILTLWHYLYNLSIGRRKEALEIENDIQFFFRNIINDYINQLSQSIPHNEIKGLPGKLYNTLRSNKTPLSKEDLIEDIWGIQYDPAFDARFYKVVERLRSYNINIINTHNSYQIYDQ